MRVSDRSTFELNRRELLRRAEDLADAQATALTGQASRRPSDDPLAFAVATKERAREIREDVRQRSLIAAQTRVDVQEQALGDIATVLRRVEELTIQAANDSLTGDQRQNLASEVAAIRDTVRGLMNADAGDRYVFGGFDDDQPPFDDTGAFTGDLNRPQVELADGVRLSVGVSADVPFDTGGPEDVLAVLADLEAAMAADDEAAIQLGLGRVQGAHARVVSARASLGGQQNALVVADAVAERMKGEAQAHQDALVGADEVDALVDLQRVQGAYNAAVRIAAELPSPGLVEVG
ncbi:MAG: hypothetical protein AAF447_05240 [Myxococcota bacterium]